MGQKEVEMNVNDEEVFGIGSICSHVLHLIGQGL